MESKPRGLCIATRCKTADELVEKLAPCCDDGWLFVNTNTVRPVGSEAPLAVMLADKTVVLRGWCVVFDAWSTSDNAFGKPGMRLGVHRLTPASMDVFERMLAMRKATIAQGRPIRHSTQAVAVVEMPTHTPTMIGIPALTPSRRTVTIPPLVASPTEEVADPTERMTTPPIHDVGNAPVVEPPKARPIAPMAFSSKPLPPPIPQLPKPTAPGSRASSTSAALDAMPKGVERTGAGTPMPEAANTINPGAPEATTSNIAHTSTTTSASKAARTAAAKRVDASANASTTKSPRTSAGTATSAERVVVERTSTNPDAAAKPKSELALVTTNAAIEPPCTSTTPDEPSTDTRPRTHERPRTSLGSPRTFRPPGRVAARGSRPDANAEDADPEMTSPETAARTPNDPIANRPAATIHVLTPPRTLPARVAARSTPNAEIETRPALALGTSPQGTPVRVATDSDQRVRIAHASVPTETRTPGSPLVLPANPLMDLTDASLEGFVDCRLYEELSPPAEPPAEPIIAPPGLIETAKKRAGTPTLPPRPFVHAPPDALASASTPSDRALDAMAGQGRALAEIPLDAARAQMPLDMGGLTAQPRTRTGTPTDALPVAMTFPLLGEPAPTAGGSATEISTATITTPLLASGSSRHTSAELPRTPTNWRALLVLAGITGLVAFAISFALAHWMR